MPHATQFSPEEVEELKRLFKEHAPPDGVITYKGRKVRVKPPGPKSVTVREVSVTTKPHPEGHPLKDAPVGSPEYLKALRKMASKHAALDKPVDSALLLHVKPFAVEKPALEGESVLAEKEDKKDEES